MVTIGFASDLHFDHHSGLLLRFVDKIKKVSPDVLVLAGDLVTGPGRIKAVLRPMTSLVSHVCFLPGNHELWLARHHRHVDSTMLYKEILPTQAHIAGAFYLGMEPFFIDRIAILGVTGWFEDYVSHQTPDRRMVRFPDTSTPMDVVHWMAELLDRQLAMAESYADEIVVVTHTLPFPKKMARFVDTETVPYLGSELLGEVILRYSKVVQVISGHMHIKYEGRVDRDSMIPWDINAFGYPEEVGDMDHAIQNAIRTITL